MSYGQIVFDALVILVMVGGFFYVQRKHAMEEAAHEADAEAARAHAQQCNTRAETLSKILKDKGIEFDADPEHYDNKK